MTHFWKKFLDNISLFHTKNIENQENTNIALPQFHNEKIVDFTKPDYLLKRYYLELEQKIILSVHSSDSDLKNESEIIAFLPDIIRKQPDCMYLIIGMLSEESKNFLTKVAKEYFVFERLFFIENFEENTLQDHFLLADLFFATNNDFEICKILTFQAKTCGLPVICEKKFLSNFTSQKAIFDIDFANKEKNVNIITKILGTNFYFSYEFRKEITKTQENIIF